MFLFGSNLAKIDFIFSSNQFAIRTEQKLNIDELAKGLIVIKELEKFLLIHLPSLLSKFLYALRSYTQQLRVQIFLFCLVWFRIGIGLLQTLLGIELLRLLVFRTNPLHRIIILIIYKYHQLSNFVKNKFSEHIFFLSLLKAEYKPFLLIYCFKYCNVKRLDN